MRVRDPITKLKGVGEILANKLAVMGIETIHDLIFFFPRRYNDFSNLTKTDHISPGPATIKVHVESITGRYLRRGLHITEAIVKDETGKLRVIWFNQPYRAAQLEKKTEFYMSGEFGFVRDRFVLQNPAVEKVSELTKNTARIVPIYPETKGLKSHQIRRLVYETIPLMSELVDPIPDQILKSENLLSLGRALQQIHFPKNTSELAKAKERFDFAEIFVLLLASRLAKKELLKLSSRPLPYIQSAAEKFINNLDFKLTNAQRRVSWEILRDIAQPKPMNRLLQGDVGSGKTIVAAFAAYMTSTNQGQSAFLAPTAVLAAQHAQTLEKILEPLGPKIGLLSGSLRKNQKDKIARDIQNGEIDIVVGTHALFQDKINFKNLNLVVVDEQHRFGVKQRKAMQEKSHTVPHTLSMSATPIPRSLMLTLYGELDISVLDQTPPGRQKIITKVLSPLSRESLHSKIEAEIEQGRQAYIICPTVTSDLQTPSLDLKNAEDHYKQLQETTFRHRRIGLLHGKLPSKQKDEIMIGFQKGQIDILVATTIIEVGVDVPNATIMVIEGAEKFGLSQLHQLRGRIGRGANQSYCYLVPSSHQKPEQRLHEISRSNDGFYLAEADLEIRGPGEIYGAKQHGADLSEAASAPTKLIDRVQNSVDIFLKTKPNLLQYRQLSSRIKELRKLTNLN